MADNSERIQKKPRGGMGHGPMGGGAPIEKPKDMKNGLSKLVRFLKPYTTFILVVVIFAIASTIFAIVSPKILGNMTTSLADSFKTAFQTKTAIKLDHDYLTKTAIILICLYILSEFFFYIQGYIMSGVAQKVTYNLRREISLKMSKLPLKYYDSVTHGEILSRITNDVDTVSNSLQQGMSQAITAITTIIGIIVMMLTISPIMTLIALVTLPVSGALVALIVKFSQKHFINQQNYLGNLNGHVEEMFSGHNVVKSYNLEEKSISEFKDKIGRASCRERV